jgi:hypothetical protein
VFQFENFESTRKSVLDNKTVAGNGVQGDTASPMILTIVNVPAAAAQSMCAQEGIHTCHIPSSCHIV